MCVSRRSTQSKPRVEAERDSAHYRDKRHFILRNKHVRQRHQADGAKPKELGHEQDRALAADASGEVADDDDGEPPRGDAQRACQDGGRTYSDLEA